MSGVLAAGSGVGRNEARSIGAVQLLFGDIRLAVIAAVMVLAARTDEAPTAAAVTLVALPMAWLLRRPHPAIEARIWLSWLVTTVDALIVLLVLAATGVDSLALIYAGVTCALAGLRHGVAGVAVTGCTVGLVHLWALFLGPASLSGDALVVVLVRLGLIVVVGLASGRLREVLLSRERLAREVQRLRDEGIRDTERRRLARDMHDSLAKTLHGALLLAGRHERRLAARRRPDADASAAASMVVEAVRQAQVEARQLLHELREDVSGELPERLATLVGDWQRTSGVPADLKTGLTSSQSLPALPAMSVQEVVRATSELLENVHRHARASRVEVRLRERSGALVLEVSDDGCGMAPPDLALLSRNGHFGLVGVGERLARIGGRLELPASGCGPGLGTTARLTFPLERVIDVDAVTSTRGVVPVLARANASGTARLRGG